MTIESIKTIAVIGAGTMGQGIAQVCAASGHQVMLYDVQPELISGSIAAIRKSLEASVEKGRITVAQKDGIMNSISGAGDFKKLKVDMVIEAVIERLDVKQKIFVELEKFNSRDCIFTTNTSSIPVTQIASVLKYHDRFAGLHFFNPATVMKLVEVVRGAGTSVDTVSLLMSLARKMGKQPVVAQDSPGFIVNRVARHYYVEALKVSEENVADFKTVDVLMRSAGFKMGPFELMDLIGVDVNFSVTRSMFHAFHEESKFRPSRTQQQKVDAGHHGRKTGKGFYDYPRE